MTAILTITDLKKTYDDGFKALKGVSLTIERGEILALLGPNGAGKTTLISTICGMVTPTSGTVTVDGHDTQADYRAARAMIGLVPQEIALQPFETVINTVRFSRGLFGKARNDAHIESVLRKLSLWDKKDTQITALSGGMKRRVLIAKALSHEPRILFLDEPTAGVDVALRKDMWDTVADLKADGVTIILTTHYIEEAEEMADRIGVIDRGRLMLVEEKARLLHQLGRKELRLELGEPLDAIPAALADHNLTLSEDRMHLSYAFDSHAERTGMTGLLGDIASAGLSLRDLSTRQSSLEEVFLQLVREGREEEQA